VRDIVNPRPPRLGPAVLGWGGGAVPRRATRIYEEKAFGGQPLLADALLADALEEAGCDQADLLGHLRGPGEHVRGCWAIDLLLGKE
jgi:hypothetical protein